MAKNIAEESGQIGGSSGSVLVLRHVVNLRGLRAVLAGGRSMGARLHAAASTCRGVNRGWEVVKHDRSPGHPLWNERREAERANGRMGCVVG